MSQRHLVITGPMGVGKTTLADRLGPALQREVRDSDRDLERLTGRTGRRIADDAGVAELHRLESAVLLGALAGRHPLVVAAAASIVDDPACCVALGRLATVIVLDVAVDVVVDRARSEDHRRDIDREAAEALRTRRLDGYRAVADHWLMADDDPAALVDRALGVLDITRPSGRG